MSLRFEDWSLNLMRMKMKEKYAEKGLQFPVDRQPFLLKVFMEPPYESSAEELKAFMVKHQIPEQYLDTHAANRFGTINLEKC